MDARHRSRTGSRLGQLDSPNWTVWTDDISVGAWPPPPPSACPRPRAAHDLRVVFSRLRRRLREVDDTDELTPSQMSVLSRLGKEGAATASDLAAAERVRPQSMAATLAALDQCGLVVRRPDPDDGRRQLVSLSPAGTARRRPPAAREEWLARPSRTASPRPSARPSSRPLPCSTG